MKSGCHSAIMRGRRVGSRPANPGAARSAWRGGQPPPRVRGQRFKPKENVRVEQRSGMNEQNFHGACGADKGQSKG